MRPTLPWFLATMGASFLGATGGAIVRTILDEATRRRRKRKR